MSKSATYLPVGPTDRLSPARSNRQAPTVLDSSSARPVASGKLIRLDDDPWFIKGVSYGTFAPDAEGWQFPTAEQVASDFRMMAQYGFNTVRLYTPPPPSMLDEAAHHGLRLMVGVPWAQHVAFLDDRALRRRIRREMETEVRRLGSHPAVLLLAIGNEVPASVARWHGRARLERFLRELYQVAKDASPDSLLTYVNYPPTEYLELPFLDVVAFNLYLHREPELRAYLARLHHVAGNRPLLLAEAGSDSLGEGEAGQAALTAMQLRASFREGACGAVAFSWTDEWWRGGRPVTDWAFGLVDQERRPKLALHAAARVFAKQAGLEAQRSWPRVSVIVCAYNAAETLEDCLSALEQLSYPDVEVLLVDDGSTDDTATIATRHPSIRLIQVENGGLSAARNVGLAHASGEIVAYTDADVCVEPEWLTYLVEPFFSPGIAGSGGPNVVPPDDPWLAQCVARAPGGPSHVLLDDRIAEHVPGCNMAFRRDVLLALDGFNPTFIKAGDDVDLCWRLQARGWKIGFAPCALVWHRHRSSIRDYWRQQLGYGEGETWLKPLHPAKFVGRRALWHGHIYSPLPFIRSLRNAKINVGVWGSAAFPSVYRFDAHPFAHLPHAILWQLSSVLLLLGGFAMLWTSYRMVGVIAMAAGAVAFGTTCGRCAKYALDTEIDGLPRIARLPDPLNRLVYRVTVAWLHFIQPIARTYGRVRGFLSAPRRRALPSIDSDLRPISSPGAHLWTSLRLLTGCRLEDLFWGERWVGADVLLQKMTDWLRLSRAVEVIEIDDGWRPHRDFSLAAGRWVWLDLRALVEEHERGRCLARVATSARLARAGWFMTGMAGVAAFALGAAAVAWHQPLAMMGGLAVLAATGAVTAAPVLRTVAVLHEAVLKVAAEVELVPMGPAEKTG